jgi:hypothetical protein
VIILTYMMESVLKTAQLVFTLMLRMASASPAQIAVINVNAKRNAVYVKKEQNYLVMYALINTLLLSNLKEMSANLVELTAYIVVL